jgi:AraC-like DNA-binding protein
VTGLAVPVVLGRHARELRERLHEEDDWEDRFTACDEVLGRLLSERARIPGPLLGAWELLVRSGGSAPVEAVADAVGWGRRHLGERFRTEFGLSPKLAARVIRFERACRMLRSGQPPVQVAAACGYHDQPHLSRDFTSFAGCPPAEWLRTELPSVQDGEPLEPATLEA